MTFQEQLLDNYLLISALLSWFVAQVCKTAIDAYFNKGINWERMTGSGGMPSSHSSTVVALATAAGVSYGVDSAIFAVGLGFAVAAHFAPAQAEAAVMAYRSVFNGASDYAQASHPRTAAAFNVVVAPTDEEAQYLATTARAANARIVAGRPGPLDEPTSDPEAWRALAGERASMVDDSLAYFFVGTPQRVAAQLHEMAQRWELEDIICLSFIHDAAARRRSYELLAQAW